MILDEFISRAIVVPFVDKGRDWSGWDCWGMVVLFHREVLGVAIPSYTDSYRDAGRSKSSRVQLQDLIQTNMPKWDRIDDPLPGDAVLLNIGGRPIHVGLAIGAGRMLHTERRVCTLIERLSSPIWEKRIEGFYRYAQ